MQLNVHVSASAGSTEAGGEGSGCGGGELGEQLWQKTPHTSRDQGYRQPSAGHTHQPWPWDGDVTCVICTFLQRPTSPQRPVQGPSWILFINHTGAMSPGLSATGSLRRRHSKVVVVVRVVPVFIWVHVLLLRWCSKSTGCSLECRRSQSGSCIKK